MNFCERKPEVHRNRPATAILRRNSCPHCGHFEVIYVCEQCEQEVTNLYAPVCVKCRKRVAQEIYQIIGRA